MWVQCHGQLMFHDLHSGNTERRARDAHLMPVLQTRRLDTDRLHTFSQGEVGLGLVHREPTKGRTLGKGKVAVACPSPTPHRLGQAPPRPLSKGRKESRG